MKLFVREEVGEGGYRPATHDEIYAAAQAALRRQFRRGTTIKSPEDTRTLCQLRLAHLPHEVFSVVWLDNRNRLIEFEELFRGTIDGASVHVREVVKSGLRLNAAACVLSHCHPSGVAEPSAADETITRRLQEALGLVEIRLLDHVIVGGDDSVSFAERGLL